MFRTEKQVPKTENEEELDRDDQNDFGKKSGAPAAVCGVVHQLLRLISLKAAFSCLHLNERVRGTPISAAFRLRLDGVKWNWQTAKVKIWQILAVQNGSKC